LQRGRKSIADLVAVFRAINVGLLRVWHCDAVTCSKEIKPPSADKDNAEAHSPTVVNSPVLWSTHGRKSQEAAFLREMELSGVGGLGYVALSQFSLITA
jgi:hypothetical protein